MNRIKNIGNFAAMEDGFSQKRFAQNLLAIFSYFTVIAAVIYSILPTLEFPHVLGHGFLCYDAVHYYRIKEYGYQASYWYPELLAFFPLFPYMWKVLDVSMYGISIFNGLIFIFSLSYIVTLFRFSFLQLLIGITFPSLIFFFLPYSEAVFFAAGAIILTGYYKNKPVLIAAGLLMASFSRPATTILLPALILTEFISNKELKPCLKNIALYSAVVITGVFIVFYFHYINTGNFFAYFTAFETWDNNFKFPLLPLTSWGGPGIIVLDGFALLFGIVAIGYCLKWLYNRYRNNAIVADKTLVFSALYIAGVTALIILLMRNGYLFSLNRLVFATPYFFVFMIFLLRNHTFQPKFLLYFFVFLQLYWLLFSSYRHIAFFQYFAFGSLFILLVPAILIKDRRYSIPALIMLISSGIALQILFYLRVIGRQWVG